MLKKKILVVLRDRAIERKLFSEDLILQNRIDNSESDEEGLKHEFFQVKICVQKKMVNV